MTKRTGYVDFSELNLLKVKIIANVDNHDINVVLTLRVKVRKVIVIDCLLEGNT